MSSTARIESLQRLAEFRTALCIFAERVRAALNEAEADVQRTGHWLHLEKQSDWKQALRHRQEDLTRARLELKKKQMENRALGIRSSCVEERQALARAQERFDEAETKQAATRRWIRQLEQEGFSFKSAVQNLAQMIETDLPGALAQLDGMLRALDDYIKTQAPETARQDQQAAAESAARSQPPPTPSAIAQAYTPLRETTPAPAIREKTLVDEPDFAWTRMGLLNPIHQDVVRELPLPRGEHSANSVAVIAAGCWKASKLIIERVAPPTQGRCTVFIGPADPAPARGYEAVTLERLRQMRPDWTALLDLPVGTLAVLAGDRLEALLGPDNALLWHLGDPTEADTDAVRPPSRDEASSADGSPT